MSGRPSVYTPELAARICARLADGESLRAICEDGDMPNRSTVHLWVIEDREGFSNQYAKARHAQALRWAEEITDIADNENKEDTQRARLRVDTRKWLLSKVLPKVYGDKVMVGGDPDGVPLAVSVTRKIIRPDDED